MLFSFLRKKPLLRDYEKIILDNVAQKLDIESRQLFFRQVASINKVQRLDLDKEVDLYCIKKGCVFLDETIRFKNRNSETLLAEAVFILVLENKRITAQVWVCNGWLFSLEFQESPKIFCSGYHLESVSILSDLSE